MTLYDVLDMEAGKKPFSRKDITWNKYPNRIKFDNEMIILFAVAGVLQDNENIENIFSKTIGENIEKYSDDYVLLYLMIENDLEFKKYLTKEQLARIESLNEEEMQKLKETQYDTSGIMGALTEGLKKRYKKEEND